MDIFGEWGSPLFYPLQSYLDWILTRFPQIGC